MNQKWPCIFTTEFTKDEVNKRLFEEFPKFKFGDFTRVWRWEHCATINPYGSDSCPYEPEDCSIAYLKTAQDAMREAHTSPVGLFKLLSKRRALDRVDNKPLARDTVRRTDGLSAGAQDLRTGAGTRPVHAVADPARGNDTTGRVASSESVGLRRAVPRSIGSLLGADGTGSHPRTRRRDEGQESTDNDGDTGDPVSPSPPRWLGNRPPT